MKLPQSRIAGFEQVAGHACILRHIDAAPGFTNNGVQPTEQLVRLSALVRKIERKGYARLSKAEHPGGEALTKCLQYSKKRPFATARNGIEHRLNSILPSIPGAATQELGQAT